MTLGRLLSRQPVTRAGSSVRLLFKRFDPASFARVLGCDLTPIQLVKPAALTPQPTREVDLN